MDNDYGKVIDPVCGVAVDPEAPFTHAVHGVTYHFCTSVCRDQFVQHPDRYVLGDHEDEEAARRSEGEAGVRRASGRRSPSRSIPAL